MSSAAHRAFRAGAPLIVAAAGWALWLRAPGSLVPALALLFCPGWGLLRLLSVIDRRFGVAGASLGLSALVLGLLALAAGPDGGPPEALGLRVHLVTLLLCAAGGLRLAAHDRWLARQAPHPAPMPLLPRGAVACLALAAAVVLGLLAASPPGDPPRDSGLLVQASRALAFQRGGEEPCLAAVPQPTGHLLAAAAASLAAAGAQPPLVAVQLLLLAALLATLLLAAETVSRLLGNRGAAAAMLAVLLGCHPLASVFLAASPGGGGALAGPPPETPPAITTALAPFLDGGDLALPLAFVALLLSSSLSVLRRSSVHVPRLAGVAAFALALCRPTAALLLLPGWIAGIASAHLMCRGRERSVRASPELPRPGEPALLRAPFWALAVPVTAGVAGGLMLAGPLEFASTPFVTCWRLLVAVGPVALLSVPGVRHLNASPGREGWFYVGLLFVSLPLLAFLGPPGDRGEEAVRVLAVLLAVPAAHGALKLAEAPRRAGRLAVVAAALLALPGPVALLHQRAGEPRALLPPVDGRPPRLAGADSDLQAALDAIAGQAPSDAVLVCPAGAGAHLAAPLLALAASRTLLAPADDADALAAALPARLASEGARRAALARDLPTGTSAPLLQIRGTPGLRRRALWAVHAGAAWPGWEPVARSGDWLVERAAPPDIVLVTVASLRASALASMPALAARAAQGVRFDQAVTGLPETLPSLASLLTGRAPHEHGLRTPGGRCAPGALTLAGALRPAGYRTAAVVALDDDGGLLADFESRIADRHAGAQALVDAALAALAESDPRPVFVWLHLQDPADALEPVEPAVPDPDGAAPAPGGDGTPAPAARYAAAVAGVDRALSRLLSSLPSRDLIVVTAPHGTNLDEGAAPFAHGADLGEPSLRVPLFLAGAGVAPAVSDRLTALQDVAALVLRGELPQRERLFLQTAGAAPGAAFVGLRRPGSKIVMPVADAAAAAAAARDAQQLPGAPLAWTFDLLADPGETAGVPADPASVRELASLGGLMGR